MAITIIIIQSNLQRKDILGAEVFPCFPYLIGSHISFHIIFILEKKIYLTQKLQFLPKALECSNYISIKSWREFVFIGKQSKLYNVHIFSIAMYNIIYV